MVLGSLSFVRGKSLSDESFFSPLPWGGDPAVAREPGEGSPTGSFRRTPDPPPCLGARGCRPKNLHAHSRPKGGQISAHKHGGDLVTATCSVDYRTHTLDLRLIHSPVTYHRLDAHSPAYDWPPGSLRYQELDAQRRELA